MIKRAIIVLVIAVLLGMPMHAAVASACQNRNGTEGLDMATTLQSIEHEYRKAIGERENISAGELIRISTALFNDIKIAGDSEVEMDDMLLFQYGIYDWGNENGRHFSFDITRQFFPSNEDEPYQLRLTLIFNPAPFEKIAAYDCWSSEYAQIEDFAAHIRLTDGYRAANEAVAIKYELDFGKV